MLSCLDAVLVPVRYPRERMPPCQFSSLLVSNTVSIREIGTAREWVKKHTVPLLYSFALIFSVTALVHIQPCITIHLYYYFCLGEGGMAPQPPPPPPQKATSSRGYDPSLLAYWYNFCCFLPCTCMPWNFSIQ